MIQIIQIILIILIILFNPNNKKIEILGFSSGL